MLEYTKTIHCYTQYLFKCNTEAIGKVSKEVTWC